MLGKSNVAQHRAALLRKTRHVQDHAGLALDMGGHAEQRADGQHTGAADAGDAYVVWPIKRRERGGLRQRADLAEIGGGAAAELGAIDRDKGRAKALQTGIILVAARLVDGAL